MNQRNFVMITQKSAYPQMGSLYLASALAKYGIKTHTIGSGISTDELEELIERVDPIAVGCSVMTAPQIVDFIRHSMHVQEKYNKRARNIPVVWGGMHPTIVTAQTLKEPYIDFVVSGEAEITLPKLLNGFVSGDFPEGKLVTVRTPFRLDEYRPSWDSVNLEDFVFPESHSVHTDLDFEKNNVFYYLLTSRGCTYQCNFCWEVARTGALRAESKALRLTEDLTWRAHSNIWIEREIDLVYLELQKKGIKMDGIGFWDDMIFGRGRPEHVARARGIFTSMHERSFGYLLEARANQLVGTGDKWNGKVRRYADLYRFLSETGCTQVFVGTESGNQDTLNMIRKGTRVSDYMRLVEMSRDIGLPLRLSMIVGFPGESDTSVNQTLDMIERMEEEPYISISGPKLFTPYPGVPQFEVARARGLKVPNNTLEWAYLDRYADYEKIYPWLTEDLHSYTLRRIDGFFDSIAAEKNRKVDEEVVREVVRGH